MHPISAILSSVALLLLGNGLLNTLLPLKAADQGYSTALIGVMMSAYFAGFACGTFVSGRLIQRVGHIRTFAFCAAICASMVLLHSMWINAWAWMVLRFVYGLAFVTLMTVIESWLNARTGSADRGKVFAVYMVVNLGAIAVAQQFLRLDGEETFQLFIIAAIFLCWALLPITVTRRPQPEVPKRAKSSLKALVRFAPLPVASAALSGLAMGAFWGMAPLYASKLGFDFAGVGLLMSVTIVGGAILQIPVGRFSDRHDRRKVLASVALLAALVAILMALLSDQGLLLVLFFIWGGMSFSLYPLAVAQLLDQLHPDEVVSGTTDMLVLHGAGAAVAPLLAGAIMNVIGPQGLPLYIALVLAALTMFATREIRRVSVLTAGEHAHFEPMVQTSHEVLEMIEKEQTQD